MTNLDDLVNRCILFTDRNGKVLDKKSTPFSSWLTMEYKNDDLSIYFHVLCSGYSNGSSRVKVEQDGQVVLEAEGSYTAIAFGVNAKTYVPGDWEKSIPLYEEILRRYR